MKLLSPTRCLLQPRDSRQLDSVMARSCVCPEPLLPTPCMGAEPVGSPAEGQLPQYRAPRFNDPALDGSMKRGPLAMASEQDRAFEPYNRGREINYWGCMVFVAYICAFIFYLWVRISKTLDLAGFLWCACHSLHLANTCCAATGRRCSRPGRAVAQREQAVSSKHQAGASQLAACRLAGCAQLVSGHDRLTAVTSGRLHLAQLGLILKPAGRYGIIVLVVEGMGFTTVILYGVNLLFNPVIMVYEEDANFPGKPITRRPYHVRVCVPCYKESLEIIRRTIMALYDAELPEVSPCTLSCFPKRTHCLVPNLFCWLAACSQLSAPKLCE